MTYRNLFPTYFQTSIWPLQSLPSTPVRNALVRLSQEPVEPNAPVSLPATDQSGFSADQLATIKALIQSCLVPPTLFSLYSASAHSLPALVLTTMPASDTPRAGPSWVSGPPPPTTPLSGPSGIRPSQSLSPRPGPSWASDPPLVEETGA